MDMVVARGKRDMKPLLLKIGIALAFSFAGYLVSRFRARLRHQPKAAPTGSVPEAAGMGLKDELRILKTEEAKGKIINGTSTTTTTTTTTTTFVGVSPMSKTSGEDEGFLLPEFNTLVGKDFESTEATPTKTREETTMEQEIVYLRNLVWSLRERERSLELQLFELYGLQEQDAAVRELESQLKISTVEAKFSSLKIESLEAENRRLHAMLSDHSKTANELDSARAKMKLLKRKMKSDGEQAREKIAGLLERVSVLQDREHKYGIDIVEVEKKYKTLKDLEEEATNLRILNSELKQENLELVRKSKSEQTLDSLEAHNPEAKALQETKQLRLLNDNMAKEIDQLQTDRYGDVEQLVYLRWVNACLRYELRNYKAPPGKTVARDLSKNLSPRSEEKAKQLILEYASSGCDEKSMGLADFDSEEYTSSQTSIGDSEDTSTDVSTAKTSISSKSKFFCKLKKLVLGKDGQSNKHFPVDQTPSTSGGNSERRGSVSIGSYEDMVIGRDLYGSFSSFTAEQQSPTNRLTDRDAQAEDRKQSSKYGRRLSISKSSADIQRLKRFNVDEVKYGKVEVDSKRVRRAYNHKVMAAGEESNMFEEEVNRPEYAELQKFAQVLKNSRPEMVQRA